MRRGDFLLSWPFLLSLGALLLNDFILKRSVPGPATGFASDAAGIVFFPIALVAAAEYLAALLPGRPLARPSWFAAASVFVGGGFVLVKATAWGKQAYEYIVGPLDELLGSSFGIGGLGVVQDPLDLLALILIPVPIWVGYEWRGRSSAVKASFEPSDDGPEPIR